MLEHTFYIGNEPHEEVYIGTDAGGDEPSHTVTTQVRTSIDLRPKAAEKSPRFSLPFVPILAPMPTSSSMELGEVALAHKTCDSPVARWNEASILEDTPPWSLNATDVSYQPQFLHASIQDGLQFPDVEHENTDTDAAQPPREGNFTGLPTMVEGSENALVPRSSDGSSSTSHRKYSFGFPEELEEDSEYSGRVPRAQEMGEQEHGESDEFSSKKEEDISVVVDGGVSSTEDQQPVSPGTERSAKGEEWAEEGVDVSAEVNAETTDESIFLPSPMIHLPSGSPLSGFDGTGSDDEDLEHGVEEEKEPTVGSKP